MWNAGLAVEDCLQIAAERPHEGVLDQLAALVMGVEHASVWVWPVWIPVGQVVARPFNAATHNYARS